MLVNQATLWDTMVAGSGIEPVVGAPGGCASIVAASKIVQAVSLLKVFIPFFSLVRLAMTLAGSSEASMRPAVPPCALSS
jgi:hypothetical protein